MLESPIFGNYRIEGRMQLRSLGFEGSGVRVEVSGLSVSGFGGFGFIVEQCRDLSQEPCLLALVLPLLFTTVGKAILLLWLFFLLWLLSLRV